MPDTPLPGWTPRPRPERRVLEGRFARLEPLDPVRHADDLFAEARGEDERHRYLFEEAPTDEAAFHEMLEEKAALADPLWFAIVGRRTGRALGRLTLMRIDEANGVVEVGNIFYGPAMMRTPMATEAIFLLGDYIFDTLGYRRFEWKCNDANEPSKRAALRYGFTPEGVFRQAVVVKGRNRDTAWFSIIDREWATVGGALRLWLAPDNFDEEGRQQRRLGDIREELSAET